MGAKLREALVQAAHLIADALESERAEPVPTKKAIVRRPRKQQRAPYVPKNVQLSDVDRARARQALKKAGIPVP